MTPSLSLPTTREACIALDRADPLASVRDEFTLPDGVVYLDGNSLGALPRRVAERVAEVTTREWGEGLIRSWNSAGWIALAARAGDKIAKLIGARPGEVSVGDSTSLNLFKALSAAVAMQRADAPERNVVLSERGNFPTDLYIAESIVASAGMKLVLVSGDEVVEHLTRDVAVLMLTHVNYRSGRVHRMRETTRAAHAAGTLAIWDLAHSAGALPLALHGADADFAVGCGYKYLNGGPGAPGLRMGAPAPHRAHGPRADAPAALRLAGACGAVRVRIVISAGRRHSALRLRHAAGTLARRARLRARRVRRRRKLRRHAGLAREGRSR